MWRPGLPRGEKSKVGDACTLDGFRQAAVQDLALLARLTGGDMDRPLLEWLRASRFPQSLSLVLKSDGASPVLEAMGQAVAGLPQVGAVPQREELTADYTGIFLSNAFGASAIETFWVGESLAHEIETVAKVEAWYRDHGYSVTDRLHRPPDFLAFELGFLAHLLDDGGRSEAETLSLAHGFLTAHPLRWVPRFSQKVSQSCKTPFYGGLARLLGLYLENLERELSQVRDDSLSVPA